MISELQEWIQLAEDYARDIEQFDLICFFCAQPFEEELVNGECELNRAECHRPILTREDSRQVGSRLNGRPDALRSDRDAKEDGRRECEGFTVERPARVYLGNNR